MASKTITKITRAFLHCRQVSCYDIAQEVMIHSNQEDALKRLIRFSLALVLVSGVFLLAGVGNAWARPAASTSSAAVYDVDPTPAHTAIIITGNEKKAIAGIATVTGINASAEISVYPKPAKAISKLLQIKLVSGALDVCFEAKTGWRIKRDATYLATALNNGRLCVRTYSGGGFFLTKK